MHICGGNYNALFPGVGSKRARTPKCTPKMELRNSTQIHGSDTESRGGGWKGIVVSVCCTHRLFIRCRHAVTGNKLPARAMAHAAAKHIGHIEKHVD